MDVKSGKIRSITTSDRHFWKSSTSLQYDQVVQDQNADYGKRKLAQNEVSVLALNEICVNYKCGYFLHLPSRQAWTVKADLARTPHERSYEQVSPNYPTVIYMNYAWSAAGCEGYFQASHRERYLLSNAIINSPPGYCPVYAIQWVSYWKSTVFITDVETLVVLQSSLGFQLLKLSELRAIVGESAIRGVLNSTPDLWTATAVQNAVGQKRLQIDALLHFSVPDIETLYKSITDMCRNVESRLPSTFTATEMRDVIPRPNPALAATIGTSLGSGLSAEPPTRRKEKKGARAQTVGDALGL